MNFADSLFDHSSWQVRGDLPKRQSPGPEAGFLGIFLQHFHKYHPRWGCLSGREVVTVFRISLGLPAAFSIADRKDFSAQATTDA